MYIVNEKYIYMMFIINTMLVYYKNDISTVNISLFVFLLFQYLYSKYNKNSKPKYINKHEVTKLLNEAKELEELIRKELAIIDVSENIFSKQFIDDEIKKFRENMKIE